VNREVLLSYRDKYKAELDKCVEFWLKNSVDAKNGGIYNSLDRTGRIFAKDKAVWLQGRCLWTFSYLCNQYGYQQKWHELAKSCLGFLNKYCIDPVDGRMYFMVSEDGLPIRKRRYFFSEAFYIIGCAEYAYAFSDEKALNTAKKYFHFVKNIYLDPIKNDPYKITPKYINRQMIGFAQAMILLNVSHIMAKCDSENAHDYIAFAKACSNDIIRFFYKEDLNALLETVGQDGEFLKDITGGRTLNPGHAIEGAWFLLTQAQNTNDAALVEKAKNIFDWSIDIGWDEKFGGIFSFVDVLGYPPEALEHDMKLWWPVCEALISSILLYEHTGDGKYFNWFEKLDNYAFNHFSDRQYGEWYGYLHYDGTPALDGLKGNLFKGPFHLPRMLCSVERCLTRLCDNYS